MTTLAPVTPTVIYVSNSLGPYGFQLYSVYQRHICHAFIMPIFLYSAITCRTTCLFITIRCNHVMGLNATIDHLECYQLGDLSSKIVTFSPRFIPIYLNYVNMCKEQSLAANESFITNTTKKPNLDFMHRVSRQLQSL